MTNRHLELNENQREKIISIVYANLDFDDQGSQFLELTDDTLIKLLPGFSSLKIVRALGQIEIEFSINLGYAQIEQVKTMGELYTTVAQAIEEKER